MNHRRIILILSLLLVVSSSQAQVSDPLEEYFYASGKIKMVIAVVSVIMVGLFVFLFYLERRIAKLEKAKKK